MADSSKQAFPTLGDEFMQVADGTWQPKSAYGMEGKSGMTLREWYAGMAMLGLLPYSCDGSEGAWDTDGTPQDIAKTAFAYADAMLARAAISAATGGTTP